MVTKRPRRGWVQGAAIVGLVALVIGVGGCASLSGETYSRDEARRVQTVEMGTIVDLRPVVIEGSRSGAGAVAGGVIGGIGGSAVGEGTGQDLAIAAGAILGGLLGNQIEEGATRAQGLEITVEKDTGRTVAVVQEVSQEEMTQFQQGMRVRLLRSRGNVRVTPITTTLSVVDHQAAPVHGDQ